MGTAGLLLIFIPQEILQSLGNAAENMPTLILQILGGLYFGFAMLNWMARDGVIGGIYNRPITIANVSHFMIGGIPLLKAAFSMNTLPALWIASALYAVFGVWFFRVLRTHPGEPANAS